MYYITDVLMLINKEHKGADYQSNPMKSEKVKAASQGRSISLSTRLYVGDLTLIMGSRLRSLQRGSRERTNCESRQSSIGFPRNGLTKAATPSLSLGKSLCKGFCFTFLPVRGLAYPWTSCSINNADIQRKDAQTASFPPLYLTLYSLFVIHSLNRGSSVHMLKWSRFRYVLNCPNNIIVSGFSCIICLEGGETFVKCQLCYMYTSA